MTSVPNTASASLSRNREAILEEIVANCRPRTTLAGIGVWARWHVRRLATWPWGRHWTARSARSTSAAAEPCGDDAEILALKREIDRLVAAGDTISDDGAAGPFYSKATELGRRIAELRATTIQALAVKLRLAANPRDGHDISEFPMRNLVSARDDAMRMAEARR